MADNGRGVGESPLGAATESDGSHIGLVGTDTRLRVFFGDDYTIRLNTSDLGGAEVVLSFRAEKTPLTAPAG